MFCQSRVFCQSRCFVGQGILPDDVAPLDVAGPGDPGAARIEWVKEPAKDDELVAPPDDGDGPANLREEAMSIRIS